MTDESFKASISVMWNQVMYTFTQVLCMSIMENLEVKLESWFKTIITFQNRFQLIEPLSIQVSVCIY